MTTQFDAIKRLVAGAALVAKQMIKQTLTASDLARTINVAADSAKSLYQPSPTHSSNTQKASTPSTVSTKHNETSDADIISAKPIPPTSSRTPRHVPFATSHSTSNVPRMQDVVERRVPSSALERAIGFGGMAASMATGAVFEATKRVFWPGSNTSSSSSSSLPGAFMSEKNFERLAAGLCRMRGAALKLGQMLSLQDETLLAPQVQAILERVRAGADVMPRKQLERALRDELGEEWESRVKSFDFVPIAAASIGQVHHAVLLDGRSVAMKIQYPGVANSIRSDLQSVKRLLQLTNVFPKGLYMDNIVEVAHDELTRECDYELEVQSQLRYRKLIKDEVGLYVPEVVPELSTKRILTTEFVNGVAVSELVHFSAKIRNDVAQRLLELCLRELFEFRFMQTDPNWANFLYNAPSDVLYLIDFGATREFSEEFVREYLLLISACADRDRDQVLRLSTSLGFLTGSESTTMLDAHVESAFVVGEPFQSDEPFDFAAADMTHRLQGLASTMLHERLTAPPIEAYTLHRKLSGLFLACIKLKATIPCRPALKRVLRLYATA